MKIFFSIHSQIQEEIKMLEMNDNFEAAAALRQKVRDLKRIERKKVMGFNCIKPGFKVLMKYLQKPSKR